MHCKRVAQNLFLLTDISSKLCPSETLKVNYTRFKIPVVEDHYNTFYVVVLLLIVHMSYFYTIDWR